MFTLTHHQQLALMGVVKRLWDLLATTAILSFLASKVQWRIDDCVMYSDVKLEAIVTNIY